MKTGKRKAKALGSQKSEATTRMLAWPHPNSPTCDRSASSSCAWRNQGGGCRGVSKWQEDWVPCGMHHEAA